jgi:DNA-binding transcriptional MocR family regulator
VTAARAGALRGHLRKAPEVLLIENDYASAVAAAGPHPLRTGHSERWVVVRSSSEFLGPDLRLALVAGDGVTIGRVRQRQALGARWVSRIIQRLVVAAWADPGGARRLARAAEVYAHRRNALQRALAERGFSTTARSGFNVWLPVAGEASVVIALRERGWLVAAGERFRLRAGPGIRITASELDEAAARRFADAAADVLNRRGATLR